MTEPKPVGGPRLASALAFVAPLVLYSVTAARTVQGGDAAEFGLLGIQGGVAHPPGVDGDGTSLKRRRNRSSARALSLSRSSAKSIGLR